MRDPFEILGIGPTSNTIEVRRAYRELVKVHHPDKGGDPEVFKKILAAYQEAMEKACEMKCPECMGTGEKIISRGFISTSIRCPSCRP